MKAPAVYILASKRNGTLYIGVTSDLIQRIWQHREGVVEGFTQQYAVKTLVWYEQHETMESAIMREKALKKWNRDWKLRLIEERNPDWNDLWFDITGQTIAEPQPQIPSSTKEDGHSEETRYTEPTRYTESTRYIEEPRYIEKPRHSREGGNPASHLPSPQMKASATQNEPTGFPPKARGNDGALAQEGEV
jgi:putative endonuclease